MFPSANLGPDFMRDEEQIFRDALQEHGVDADVSKYEEPAKATEVFRIKTRINGTVHGIEKTVSHRERMQIDDIDQHLAHLAESAARRLREDYVEQHEWGEKAVEFDPSGKLQVTCLRCGANVSENELKNSFTSVSTAELSVPNPSPPDISSLPEQKLRFTLLALLRNECEQLCPNSAYDRKF